MQVPVLRRRDAEFSLKIFLNLELAHLKLRGLLGK
jgi:hypothetical protein